MNTKRKGIFLFVALLLPVGVFIFLKFFGRNEFEVPLLYQHELPPNAAQYGITKLPYTVGQDVLDSMRIPAGDSIVLVLFGDISPEKAVQIKRVEAEFGLPVYWYTVSDTAESLRRSWKQTVFFLDSNQDLAIVDTKGRIRGQYQLSKRDDVDRLITELTIIFKQY